MATRFHIDTTSPVPRYHQIQENLAELIESGTLKEGESLPSERELSEVYGVNRMTVRQAIDVLVNKGVLQKQHGIGTFVRQKVAIAPTVMGFTQRMRGSGLKPSSRLLSMEVVTPQPKVYRSLNLNSSEKVVRIERLRLVDGEPLMVETSYLPYARFPNLVELDVASASLYELLEARYGVRVCEAEQTLEPTLLNDHEAQLFTLPKGQPAMLVQITAYDAEKKPIEFSKSVVRGDRCQYYFRVTTALPIVS
jgi:GntR family transcriptional regulator